MNTRPDSSPSPRPHRIQPRPLQPGTHLARCSAVIDLGTHDDAPASSIQHRASSIQHRASSAAKRRLLLTFTLFAPDGSTQRLSRQFTHSTDVRSSLSKFLTPWLGTSWKQPSTTVNNRQQPSTSGLRVSALAEAPCLRVSALAEAPCLLVLQPSEAVNPATGQPWLNITSASPIIAGLEVPDLKWPATVFSLKAPNREVFQHLPAWIQTKIRASHEWQAMKKLSPARSATRSVAGGSSSSSIKAPRLTHA